MPSTPPPPGSTPTPPPMPTDAVKAQTARINNWAEDLELAWSDPDEALTKGEAIQLIRGLAIIHECNQS